VNEEQPATQQLPADGASPMPASFFWALWIPAFCVMVWGLMVLFRVKPGPLDD